MPWTLTDTTTGVDLTNEVDAPSMSIAQRAYAETSRLSGRITDESGTISILTEHEMTLLDTGVKAFAGYVRTRRRTDRGVSTQRVYEIECQDYTTALGDDVADSATAVRGVETDKARIAALGAAFGTRGVVYSGVLIVQLAAAMPAQDYTGLTLHECLTEICKVTGGSFYVDFDKQLHYFASEALSAPFNLSDNPNGTTTFGFTDFSLNDDTAQFVNAVFVQGTGISGWRPSAGAVATLRAAGTLRAMVIRDEAITDATMLNAAGDSALATYGAALQPSSLVTYKPGLRAGMTVQVTHSGWGISAVTYRIASIEARPVDKDRIAYSVFFGSNPISLTDLMRSSDQSVAEAYLASIGASQAAVAAVLDLSIGGANLVPNSSFEDSTTWGVGANWTIGFAASDAFSGAKEARWTPTASLAVIFTPMITVDRLASYWASGWIFVRARTAGGVQMYVEQYNAANALLATTNIGPQTAVTPGWVRVMQQFSPATLLGAVVWNAATAKVRVGFSGSSASNTGTFSVDGAQLERGDVATAYAPAPYEITDGSITTVEIADDAITAPKILAGAVVAGKVAASAITATELAANAVTAGKIAAGAVTADKLLIGGGQYLTNPDFETGDGAGWSYGNSGGGGSFGTGNDAGWRSQGRYYMTITSTATGYCELSQVVNGFHYGDVILLSALMANSVGARFAVEWWDQFAAVIRVDYSGFVNSPDTGGYGSTGPRRKSWASPPAPANTAHARIIIANQAVSTVLLVDDVWLSRVGDLITPNGTVRIDSTGVTITNGALFFADAFGEQAVGGYGFGPSWQSFLRTGFFNGDFAGGSTSDIAVSEVGSGLGLANYLASLSLNLPHWVVSSSGGTVARVVDATATRHSALKFTQTGSGQVARVYQDVAVIPGKTYRIARNWRWTLTGSGSGADATVQRLYTWMDEDHQVIGTENAGDAESLISFWGLATTAYRQDFDDLSLNPFILTRAPANAAYLRVKIEVEYAAVYTAGTVLAEVWLSDLSLDIVDSDLVALHFVAKTVPANATTQMKFADSDMTNAGRISMPWAGAIVGISARVSSAITVGAATFRALLNGVSVSPPSGVVGVGSSDSQSTSVETVQPFSEGDTIGMNVITSSGQTPANQDMYGIVWVAVRRRST